MPTEQETRTIRYAEIVASMCLLLVVIVWFATSLDFASLVALVTALGAVIALYRRRIPGREDLFIIVILIIVTGIGLYLIFGTNQCIEANKRLIRCEISESLAVQALYSEDVDLTANNSASFPNDSTMRVILAEPFSDGDIKRFALFTQRIDPASDCPTCYTYLDGAIFSHVDDNWILDIAHKGIVQVELNNRIPDTELIHIGPTALGYMYRYSGSSDSFEYQYSMLLTQQGDRFEVIFNMLTAMNNYAECENNAPDHCWGYELSINFNDSGGDYFDILTNIEGSIELENGTVVPINKVNLYRYSYSEDHYIELQ